jgi:hypothetical protein
VTSLIVLVGAFPYPSIVVYLLPLWVLIVSVAMATEPAARKPTN